MIQKILSISVAAYNAEKYIREVLDSIIGIRNLNQIEIFVIDDGGQDSTLSIAKQYEEKYPGIVYAIHKHNGGWGSTVNYAIEHAQGKYFRLLDGDDYYDTHNLDLFIDYLTNMDSDLVISNYLGFDDETHKTLFTMQNDLKYKENNEYHFEDISNDILLAMHAVTVKTCVLQKNNIRLAEHCLYRDMEFTSRSIAASDSISFYHKVIYHYRLGRAGQSVDKESYFKHRNEHESIIHTIFEIAIDSSESKKALLYVLARGAVSQHYKIFFYKLPTSGIYHELRHFDSYLRRSVPDFYKQYKPPKPIDKLQLLNFHGYYLLCLYYSMIRVAVRIKKQII